MRLRRMAAVGWTSLILVACWMPRKAVHAAGEGTGLLGIPHFDKVVHLGVFAVFVLLWLAASRRPRYAAVTVAGLALAVITELGQLVPLVNRQAAVDDGAVDLLGVLAGVILFRYAAPWAARKWDAAPSPIATGSEAA
ncbi:VanZ family protein [Paludisphaera sp.]|uniref:VanZ family protein n=1 Tax=Paludisphaera sp. TaxID=2017432 RepID=UPI00301D9D95